MARFDFTNKPTGLLKWFLHAPSYVYRARLGFVFGERFLMIEHTGRTSGNRYRTVLEVAGRHTDRNEWISSSGTGPNADWYRNLLANGVDAIWIGSTRHSPASVRFLGAEEAGQVFAIYEAKHPRAATKLMDTMGVSYDGTDEGRVEMMHSIPMVAFSY